MPSAAVLLLLAAGILLAGARVGAATPEAARSLPTRPAAAIAATVVDGISYVSAQDAAARLGLKERWTKRLKTLTLSDARNKLEFAADSREATVNGRLVYLGDATLLRRGQLYLSRIDFERRLLPVVRPALCPAIPSRPTVIALDPGHGRPDDGMTNDKLGLKERVLTLDVARRLRKLLEAAGYKVVLTRDDDDALSPEKKIDFPRRAAIANRAGADVFVSIHFNSLYPDTRTHGTEVYTYAPATQHAVGWWGAPRKTDPDLETEPAPVNRFDAWSSLLAHELQASGVDTLKTPDRGAKIMHLAVLRNVECPAGRVEAVFLSNDDEARRAATAEYREEIARALLAGIRTYATALEGARRGEKSAGILLPLPSSGVAVLP